MKSFPDVHFGRSSDSLDWREYADEIDPDDEELTKSPPDLIAMLGFDPKELEGDD